MSIRNRIKKLEGLRKEALNFKLFEKIWPRYQESNSYNASLDAEKAFDLYQRGLLGSDTQTDIEKIDKQTSLHGVSVNAPSYRETRLSPESKERYKGMIEKRMIAEQESAKRQMMSGRHSAESFIPTSYLDPDSRIQSLGPKESPIKTVSETGELIYSDTMGSEAGSVWAPYILLYKGSNSIVARQYANPNEARWVSSHPDISSGYGKKGGGEGFLEVYDLRKVPKEKRNFFTKHIGKDTKGMSEDEITEAVLAGNSEWGASPYYETIIEDEDLRKARIAKYKSLPDLGWMLVEGRNILKEGLTKEEAREHLDILKSEAGVLAKENPKMYFYYNFNKIMDRELTVEALKSMSKKDPEYFLKHYRTEAKNLGLDLVKQALEALAGQNPYHFLTNYREEAKNLGLVDLVKQNLETLAKKDPGRFLRNYREEALSLGLDDLARQALETLAKKDPSLFLGYYREEASDLAVKIALEIVAKENPRSFLDFYREEAMRLGLVDLEDQAFEALAKQDPYYLYKYYSEEANRLGLVDLEKQALEALAKEDPTRLLEYYRAEASDLAIKIALETVAKEDPDHFLFYYKAEANRLGFPESINIAFEALAKKDPDRLLKYYRAEASDLAIKIALEVLAKENPYYLLSNYGEEARRLGLFDLENQASLANHLVKLSKALDSLGMTKEASRVRYLLNIR